MAADVRALKDRAAELAAKGKLEKAAELYREALQRDAHDVATHQKLAEVLRRAGRTEQAVEAYRAVADRFAHDGLLVKAIAISKTILELEPGHVATQAALADLYARRSRTEKARPAARTLVTAAVRAPAPAPAREAPPPAPPAGPAPSRPARADTGFQRIVLAAGAALDAGVEDAIIEGEAVEELVAIVGDEPLGPPAAPPAAAGAPAGPPLPRVPIFSDLSHEAFVALTAQTALRRVAEGEEVIREGDASASFYVVATGTLAVSKRDERGAAVVLARLGEGDFFGEMALLSGGPRVATVVAETRGELLEFRPEALLSIAARHPHLAESLRRFYRQRILANAMAVSPIFRPFPRDERKRIMERFRSRAVAEGEVLVQEGRPSDGLYVVLDGRVDVVKRRGAGEVLVSQLREGDLFGEMSCLRKATATASVVVRRGGTVLRLPREAFDELVLSHPQILELVAELSEERAQHLDAIVTGRARWTDEGLVLV